MEKKLKRVAVTGGGGQIAYALLFRIAAGEMLGNDQPVALHILELQEVLPSLEGVRMELEDCAFPLLKEIVIGSNPKEIFKNVDYALLVGAKPRGPGMERKDLLQENAKIFVEQGKALNESASKDVKVLVVGNPCNTNCLIAMHHAPNIPKQNFFAMTRLDQNRASAALAKKAKVDITEVSHTAIWGNHSNTQVPDFVHARIKCKPAAEVIKDEKWLKEDFISLVQKRGAAIIEKRGKSSAASAANAAIDAMKSIIQPTKEDHFVSMGILSDGNPYGVEEGLIFSFPVRFRSNGHSIVENLKLDEFLTSKIKLSEKELMEEKSLIQELLNG